MRYKLLKYAILPLGWFVALLVVDSIEHSLDYTDNSGRGSKSSAILIVW
jgi:hypothetical protein